jgi:hypothetical protein
MLRVFVFGVSSFFLKCSQSIVGWSSSVYSRSNMLLSSLLCNSFLSLLIFLWYGTTRSCRNYDFIDDTKEPSQAFNSDEVFWMAETVVDFGLILQNCVARSPRAMLYSRIDSIRILSSSIVPTFLQTQQSCIIIRSSILPTFDWLATTKYHLLGPN